MQSKIRKATFILRLWIDDDTDGDQAWRGTADRIGGGLPYQFQTLDECIIWLHQELKNTEKNQQEIR